MVNFFMKFIGTSWSPNMVSIKDWDMRCHQLTEEEFKFLCYDAHSCINQENLAMILGVDYNPEHISLRPNDVLLVAHLKGKMRLADDVEELPQGIVLEFYCYQILESETPLIREEEEILMEE